MIIGLGLDLCDIRRIERMLEKYGDRFPRRCFTEIERAKADGRKARAETYAKRFAAKEACAKALGSGIGQGVSWLDMGVINDEFGRPALVLTGGAAARLARITPYGCKARVHLTMTDEYPLAQAQVMIEALPKS